MLRKRDAKLLRDCVANVSALLTINRSRLKKLIAPLTVAKLRLVDDGLRRILALSSVQRDARPDVHSVLGG